MSRRTKEEIVALRIVDILSDIRIDLDMVGMYLGKYTKTVFFKRLEHIYEVAKHHEQESKSVHYDYIRNIGS